MVNDNDRGSGADRLPSSFSLGDSFRAVLLRASNYRQHLRESDLASTLIVSKLRGWMLPFQAGWQRLLTPAGIDAQAPGSSAGVRADELRAALRAHRSALIGIAIASGIVGLSLTAPLFMLQVYDRVLPSRSVPTLVGLALLVLVLFAFQGLLDMLRGRILLRVGRGIDERLSPRVFELIMRAPLQGRAAAEGQQPIRDLDNVRSFMSSTGLTAFFDLPWLPIYVAVCFCFIPSWASRCCSEPCSSLAHAAHRSDDPGPCARRRHARDRAAETADAARRNAALLQALGMRPRMTERWTQANENYLQSQQAANDMTTGLGSLSRVSASSFSPGFWASGPIS